MNMFTKDENNKDIILDPTLKHQIMMEWEKPYMEACIQKLQPFGDVLEIGFGLGYSATEIQKFPIKSYTVIECDVGAYQRALRWKEKYNHKINIIHDRWENVYKSLPKFDCLFFDDYDIKTLELCKIDNSIPCRNIEFIDKIKNNLKPTTKFSFYCATNKNEIMKYKKQWIRFLGKKCSHIDFEEYDIDVPDNCKYIVDQILYCPLIKIKESFNYY
jgi:guanidinoacetate N-methyltransferase